MIKYLKDEELRDVIKSGVWIVDFYADWCGPCKMLGAILEELDFNVLKINVDEHSDLATMYGVMSIPTICFFKDGDLKQKEVGFKSKEVIENIVQKMGN